MGEGGKVTPPCHLRPFPDTECSIVSRLKAERENLTRRVSSCHRNVTGTLSFFLREIHFFCDRGRLSYIYFEAK